jgi:hypothetical protein
MLKRWRIIKGQLPSFSVLLASLVLISNSLKISGPGRVRGG